MRIQDRAHPAEYLASRQRPRRAMNMPIRAAAIRGADRLIDELGGDATDFLSCFGVTHADLDSESAVLPAVTATRILRGAARTLDCPDFGLRLAAHQDLAMFAPLALAVDNCATVGDALDCVSRFLFLHNPTLRLTRGPDPQRHAGVAVIAYQLSVPDFRHEPQAVDAGLGQLHRTLVQWSGGYDLLGVHLPHPPLVDPEVYAEFFGAPVHFDSTEALLRVRSRLFGQPMPTPPDPVVRQMAVQFLESNFTDPREGFAATVHAAVRRGIGTVPLRIEIHARALHVHPRTLQRRLAAEGTSFEAIVDEVRRNEARRLLTETDLPLSQVSARVELADQSGLTRAVRRWFGTTPSQLRRDARQPVAQR
ncbi:AraC family transcriptional regulator [Nocardia farcinica]|uniref:AraC family transcriptional regulator n=1 Tax=Nocardia farcinica TaxID=37329 RepID=UPI0024559ADE|nr:AraC family transcriptional regulator [Nocardia farcinica]